MVSLAGGGSLDELESEPESDLEAPVMWTAMEGVGYHGRRKGGEEETNPAQQPPPPPPSQRPLHNPNAVVAKQNMSRPKSMGHAVG